MAILISDKTVKSCYKRQGPYILMKWLIHQEDIKIMNIYAPNQSHTKDLQ